MVVDGFKIWWRKPVVDFINRMSREGLCQVVWLTTWTSTAAELLAPALGLDDFLVLEDLVGSDWPDQDWWKWKCVEAVLRAHPDQPFVWTDDDFSPLVQTLVRAATAPGQAHLEKPESNPALTDDALRRIEQFLKGKQVTRG